MTREETLVWAKSLKPGDEVIYTKFESLFVLKVEKVTPAGWVKTKNGLTFAQDKHLDRLFARGANFGSIEPITEELYQKAKDQDEERKNEARKQKIINKARDVISDEWCDRWNMTYERAEKIIAAFERINGESEQ